MNKPKKSLLVREITAWHSAGFSPHADPHVRTRKCEHSLFIHVWTFGVGPQCGPARASVNVPLSWNTKLSIYRGPLSWWRHQMETFSALMALCGTRRSPVNFPHKGQRRGALIFFFSCAWMNDWVNNREACDLRRHRAYYDVIVMNTMLCTAKPR